MALIAPVAVRCCSDSRAARILSQLEKGGFVGSCSTNGMNG